MIPAPNNQAPSAPATPAAPAPQSEASKIIGLLFTLGVAAASVFVKNPNHVATAGTIVNILQSELGNLEALL
jgi:hypothetical protein